MDFLAGISTADLEAQLKAAQRLAITREARDRLLSFMSLTMPDPEDVDDATRSQYVETPQARLLCELIEKVERGVHRRVAVSIGPQHGKSQIISRGGPAWISGRNPRRHVMLGTYNQTFANEFGDEVRDIVRSNAFLQVFPGYELRAGAQAKDLLITKQGGRLAFVGVGGSGTGKPADFFIVDDPIKSDEDAQSPTYRDNVWRWFTRVAMTRCHSKSGIIIVHTRWHEDDLIGRLCDPDHPEHDPEIAKRWFYINLPAVIEDPDLAKALGLTLEPPDEVETISVFGTKPMSALWPERKGLAFLAEAKRVDPRGFNALYMGKPTPDDGAYFTSDMLAEYERGEMPPAKNLQWYGASDHAVSEKQERDSTVLGCVGVDANDDIWVPPDIVWDRMETDRTVEEMLLQMKTHRPLLWWMESDLISKSFGPFLYKRMQETNTYTTVDPVRPAKDKRVRARAIQGRMSMRKVHFPSFAPWWPAAKTQLLKFPFAAHDDFVDWLSWIGLGLTKEAAGVAEAPKPGKVVAVGSMTWIMAQAKRRALRERRDKAVAGW